MIHTYIFVEYLISRGLYTTLRLFDQFSCQLLSKFEFGNFTRLYLRLIVRTQLRTHLKILPPQQRTLVN